MFLNQVFVTPLHPCRCVHFMVIWYTTRLNEKHFRCLTAVYVVPNRLLFLPGMLSVQSLRLRFADDVDGWTR